MPLIGRDGGHTERCSSGRSGGIRVGRVAFAACVAASRKEPAVRGRGSGLEPWHAALGVAGSEPGGA